ncbi:c-type cytochrome [Catenovulum sp. 2E275]|uniref:DUF7133 domain-containing protein n=1 Tax=Catenovulum sp. 2E275 TaxID=2980497 RepID=UPI0021D3C0B8|nr:HEAT repeat domain-containing protein [Catenovulum sp. 2E275]MCU4674140.1 c-type cytochrome [Catenovulum sp. 2E275]
MSSIRIISLIAIYLGSSATVSYASDAEDKIKADAQSRLENIVVPNSLKVDVWADQTLTQNPTYFNFDSQGRMLMAEVDRIYKGVDDIRAYPVDMLIQDIEIKTLQDRVSMYQKHAERVPMSYYQSGSDQIKLIADTNQDGKADSSQIFADGFNDTLDGLGVDVIERDGKVYYTNIPNLWQLEDTNNDGTVDKKTIIQTGFGTRVSFMGHDMHGLIWGPDGKLYWSLGDRGYDIITKEGKHLFGPNLGAVFRANPDGSELELFYTGLRNPQELVFDEYGNLFTADNDGDKSDIERINHLIEGGDSGWTAGHQSIMSFSKQLELRSYKYTNDVDVPVSWLVNDMSRPKNEHQPAFILPSIGEIFTGPSGFAYNPSNYLGEEWRNTFFVALYGGTSEGSRISSFKVDQNGASFLTTPITKTIYGFNATDVGFGPDGRLYMTEFNYGGWSSKGEGTVYVVDAKNTSAQDKQLHDSYYQILTSDLTQKTDDELISYLAMDHQQVRQKAQFELAKRGLNSYRLFKTVAFDSNQHLFARIHSIWGIGQLANQGDIDSQSLKSLLPLLTDKTAQIRIQTARVLGDNAFAPANRALITALTDSNPQVKMYAAQGLGKIGNKASVKPLIDAIVANNNQDLWLRHALAMGLKGIAKKHWLNEYKDHSSAAVRMAQVLTLRMLNDPDLALFLNDSEPSIVNEAIIAISDKQIIKARAQLAAKLSADLPAKSAQQAYIHHRLINANFNLGTTESARRLLEYAAQTQLPERLISEALAAIEGWNELNPIDTITGQPSSANQERANIKELVKAHLPKILNSATGQASVQAMRLAEHYDYQIPAEILVNIVTNPDASSDIRLQSLNSLKSQQNNQVISLSQTLLKENSSELIKAGLTNIFENDVNQGLAIVESYLNGDSLLHKKIGLSFLVKYQSTQTDVQITNYMQDLINNQAPTGLILELLDAAQVSQNAQIKALLQTYQSQLAKQDLMTQYASTLEGGDIKTGREIFHGGGAAQCMRCHRVNGEGQSRVGPDLTGLATRYNSEYLLQSLIEPSAAIAPKFGRFTLSLKSGNSLTGLLIEETEQAITLEDDNGKQTRYLKTDINEIKRPMSGMPPMGYILNKHQIRDLIAYLKTLTHVKRVSGH